MLSAFRSYFWVEEDNGTPEVGLLPGVVFDGHVILWGGTGSLLVSPPWCLTIPVPSWRFRSCVWDDWGFYSRPQSSFPPQHLAYRLGPQRPCHGLDHQWWFSVRLSWCHEYMPHLLQQRSHLLQRVFLWLSAPALCLPGESPRHLVHTESWTSWSN